MDNVAVAALVLITLSSLFFVVVGESLGCDESYIIAANIDGCKDSTFCVIGHTAQGYKKLEYLYEQHGSYSFKHCLSEKDQVIYDATKHDIRRIKK